LRLNFLKRLKFWDKTKKLQGLKIWDGGNRKLENAHIYLFPQWADKNEHVWLEEMTCYYEYKYIIYVEINGFFDLEKYYSVIKYKQKFTF
jgi:hypothetical protein